MKFKDIKNLKQKTFTELKKELSLKRQEIAKISLERKIKQIKNNRLLNTLKDDVARILTVIGELKFKENLKK